MKRVYHRSKAQVRVILFLYEAVANAGSDGKERKLAWWEALVYGSGEIIDWDPEGKLLRFLQFVSPFVGQLLIIAPLLPRGSQGVLLG